jgi:hypothetical protein
MPGRGIGGPGGPGRGPGGPGGPGRGIGGPGPSVGRAAVVRRHRRMRRRMRRRMIIGGMAIVAVGTSATKMSQAEVQQVEQKAGQPVENLSEEQLDATMGELGIEGAEPTDAEVAQLEAEEDKNPSV